MTDKHVANRSHHMAARVHRASPVLLIFALLAASTGGARASAPPLPAPCSPFATKGGQPAACTLELFAGYTYVIYTDCGSVKGDTQLTLRDPNGEDVAFNDGFPFCPGDTSASLVEYKMECGRYGTSAKFSLLQDCFEDTECSGSVVSEYSSKEPPVDCGRGPFACTKQDATCEALGDLYYATNGAGWLIKDGWETAAAGIATDYCSFYHSRIPPHSFYHSRIEPPGPDDPYRATPCDEGGVLTNLYVRRS